MSKRNPKTIMSDKRVRLRKVTVEGFRCFVDRQETPELPDNGLVGVKGRNLDYGSSSGAGKSSLLIAICYAFGIAPFAATKLQSKWTKKPMQVDVELDTAEGPALLRRGKVTSIKVGQEEEITGAVAAVDNRLYRLLGLQPELLKSLSYRQQRKPGFFLTMKDSARKEFLGTLLGLGELEDRIEEATKAANKTIAELQTQETVLSTLEHQLVVPLEPRIQDFPALELVVKSTEADWLEAKRTLQDVQDRLTDFAKNTQNHKTYLAEKILLDVKRYEAEQKFEPLLPFEPMTPEVKELGEKYKAAKEAYQKKSETLSIELSDLRAELSDYDKRILAWEAKVLPELALKKNIDSLKFQIESAEAAKCGTCQQTWVPNSEQVDMWRSMLAGLEIKYSKVLEDKAFLAELQKSRIETKERIDKFGQDPETHRLKETMTGLENALKGEAAQIQLKQRLHEAEAQKHEKEFKDKVAGYIASAKKVLVDFELESQKTIRDLTARVSDAKLAVSNTDNAYKLAVQRRDSANAMNVLEGERYKREKKTFDSLNEQVEKVSGEVDKLKKQMTLEADFAAMLKAFLANIFDEVLAEIAIETNQLLRRLKNVATTSLQFTTVKNEIRPVLMKNGQELDLEAHFSGGQGSVIELAADLALSRVVGNRVGHRPGWLIIDEAFENLDIVVKESCLEVLQLAADDTLILIVDHASELKDYFASFIEVESQNEIARIVN